LENINYNRLRRFMPLHRRTGINVKVLNLHLEGNSILQESQILTDVWIIIFPSTFTTLRFLCTCIHTVMDITQSCNHIGVYQINLTSCYLYVFIHALHNFNITLKSINHTLLRFTCWFDKLSKIKTTTHASS